MQSGQPIYGPAGHGPPGYGPPTHQQPPGPTRHRGFPTWLALLVVVVLGVAVLLLEPIFIKGRASGAPRAGSSGHALPAQAVSTGIRPSQSPRTFADPLPASIRPSFITVNRHTDHSSTPPGYDGLWRPVSRTQFSRWVAHVCAAGWTNTPGEKNSATDYDLHRGHARLLGGYLPGHAPAPGAVTFVYDPNGY